MVKLLSSFRNFETVITVLPYAFFHFQKLSSYLVIFGHKHDLYDLIQVLYVISFVKVLKQFFFLSQPDKYMYICIISIQFNTLFSITPHIAYRQ